LRAWAGSITMLGRRTGLGNFGGLTKSGRRIVWTSLVESGRSETITCGPAMRGFGRAEAAWLESAPRFAKVSAFFDGSPFTSLGEPALSIRGNFGIYSTS
jgi:hypothetical protein